MRDLLRRRTNLVHQRTGLILSFQSLYTRTTGQRLELKDKDKKAGLTGSPASGSRPLITGHPSPVPIPNPDRKSDLPNSHLCA